MTTDLIPLHSPNYSESAIDPLPVASSGLRRPARRQQTPPATLTPARAR
jgi:hypothetical protein